MSKSAIHYTPIPTQWIGPIKITGNVINNEEIYAPLATYETPLWPSCGRGAKVSRQLDEGIIVTLLDARMTRSVIFDVTSAAQAHQIAQSILLEKNKLQEVVSQTSRFAELIEIHHEIVGNLLFLRFAFHTGDASGHNMATKAADALIAYLLAQYTQLKYGSISGNYCIDKKASAVNGILGRGKRVVAEMCIPEKILSRFLRTDAEKMVLLNTRKNHIGSNLAGSIRSANAHFANMLLAFYLATGQDAANIIEGSQGIVHTENRNGDLYFSCSLPNLIVGTVGNGKGEQLSTIEEHLIKLGCREERIAGENANRLAAICVAIVLCGELSLLAAQTNPGELMRAHIAMERRG
ncbi:hydroxymethylglutaryl-CoA reductase [Suttonella ornithocola]|uniref:Panthothenate synthetase n=1 Tax=Suttonella ornithocola TaxID=279832 RepID=A0A380MWZ5_9GAMM|nr:hydroxymethylglutaryl-CoA reductase [Suttonella ornithocola]SUO96566.1 Panthothenate synthetase [Suttonella ornithocola]